jgi:AmmeMemoRadiSam system protein B
MLPRLRASLDFMPSPLEDRPGLLIRDPFRFSDATLIVPPELIPCLAFFDGDKSALDLREYLVRLTGDLDVSELQNHLQGALSEAGFLEDERFSQIRESTFRAFRDAPERQPVHAGSGYPDDAAKLAATIGEYMSPGADEADPPDSVQADSVVGIAAPHVSPFGGIAAYRAAYRCLKPEDAQRTFVVLGTSHYGEPSRLGLTRKPYVTPFGKTETDAALVDEILREAGEGAVLEDYCHAVEHSIEFQIVFLQHLFGPSIRVVPLLCGPFARSLYEGGFPEDEDRVRRLFGALGNMAAREGRRLLWVLGVDMAHMGRRYGDPFTAQEYCNEMAGVEQLDRARIERMEQGDAQGFWELVRENQDELKWCGSAPIYTFLRSVPNARAKLQRYQQWNIDPASVVSFAGVAFR